MVAVTAWDGEADGIRAAVDALAELLERSVVVNDPLVRQLYGSRHFDDEDPIRIRALLQHDVRPEVVAHVQNQGVTRWQRAGRLAGHLSSACCPVGAFPCGQAARSSAPAVGPWQRAGPSSSSTGIRRHGGSTARARRPHTARRSPRPR
jgi:hypothetical protein